MKKFIPNEEAVIEAELRADDRERDLKWVRERLALRGLETGCHRCDMRWRNISSLADTLEAKKKAGFESVDIDRAIDLIKSLY